MEQRSITCPACQRTSYHPKDVEQGYCSACDWWTSDPTLAPYRPTMPVRNRPRYRAITHTIPSLIIGGLCGWSLVLIAERLPRTLRGVLVFAVAAFIFVWAILGLIEVNRDIARSKARTKEIEELRRQYPPGGPR